MAASHFHRGYAADYIARGPHDVPPDSESALRFVQAAEMGEGWLHPNSSNYTFVVELCLGSKRGFGVYKPAAGEAPLWDFPTGTLHKRECAAFELARLLGWSIAPPTVIREGELGVGSLQLYVPPEAGSNYFQLRDTHREEVIRMAVFDIIANNADRKGGHCFVAQSGGVWGVDHGLTFNVQRKLRTVIWDYAGQRVPANLLTDVRRLLQARNSHGIGAFGPLPELLSHAEAEALERRLRAFVAEPVLPEPYSRRDLPWPWL